jgi:predicted Fe-S protein YdhL (DUF1289 family)
MPNYYCINTDCPSNGAVVGVPHIKISIAMDGSIRTTNSAGGDIICDVCERPLQELKEQGGYCVTVGKWSSMPDHQKKAAIKKISDRDFKLHGKEEKEFRKKKVIEGMQNGN